jgi:arginine-tRNA-protein transferase
LFVRYLKHRHRHGGMDDYTPESYRSIIASEWSHTVLYETRLGSRLLAVAVVDEIENGLSSVYTYFDPAERGRSLGTFSVLWQIDEAIRRGMAWVYLGYWIQACRKMAYKANFHPHEIFVGGKWIARPS